MLQQNKDKKREKNNESMRKYCLCIEKIVDLEVKVKMCSKVREELTKIELNFRLMLTDLEAATRVTSKRQLQTL